jgi:tetratricopeptide (TPR) repeat protein
LAKTYIERDKYAPASYIINRLERENLSGDLKKDLYLMKTYFFLRQKRNEDAAGSLAIAIDNTSSRQEKARYSFILGQLYEMLNNTQEAFKYFKMVGDLKPDYDLEFNAQLKLLRNYSGASDEYAMRELKKLLGEDKYSGFEDAIYFTKGEIQLRRNNIDEAVEGFNNSLRNNKNNNPLKADTYYYLADINFNNQDYLMAKNYYDSCLAVLSKTDERFNSINNLSTNLTGISANLTTITLQDSLIRISKMSKEEQIALATDIKKRQLEEEEKRKKPQQTQQTHRLQIGDKTAQSGMELGMQGKSMDRGRTSSFFAYNETAMIAGKQEFSRRWGAIRLEDNWRRSNKSSSYEFDDIETRKKEITISEAELTTLLRGVPRNPDQLEEAEAKIRNAMLQLGILYREKLFNYQKSVDILEELLSRYSDFDQECEAMYNLQMSYKDLRNFPSAESWISKMSTNHPECVYTKILTDPDFVSNINRLQNTKATYYNSIFEAFNSGNYTSAQSKITNAPPDLMDDPQYRIKLDLISARLTGQIAGIDEYILALEDFLKQYPQSQEAITVREILRFLKGDTESFSKIIYEEESEDFVYEPDVMHYIILLIKGVTDNREVDEIKSSISRYNNTNYKLEGLKISNIYLDTKGIDQIILLRRFNNAESAMKYYTAIEKNRSEFIQQPVYFESYAISQKNYREVIKQKTLENYKLFFNKYYKEKQ